ncbi:winged helix-turn-helix domain-containing protein [Microlunatus parietis]|uniref:DNA-binding MarR family transcriptional regulator n=1 Tax=Microlunatus parietis TaxID=682979 RepID=A0A7Y9I979_9ACTN|nr:transcriptional regulator [Microlunatus parietis]NYE72517.1 DNA-binding MarR family transcriptional regulator [Microlunatus parietis]
MSQAQKRSRPGRQPEEIDKLVRDHTRMGILTVLSRLQSAEFLFLQSTLKLTQGNLSSHLAKLESAGLISVLKSFRGKKPVTTLAITPLGREAIDRHWEHLEALRRIS